MTSLVLASARCIIHSSFCRNDAELVVVSVADFISEQNLQNRWKMNFVFSNSFLGK